MQKPTLLSIKQEEPVSSDGEHGEPFNDNTLSDSDGEGHETADAGHQVAVNTTKYEENEANDDGKKDNILAMVPFMAETVIEPPPAASNMFECYLCHKTWKSAGNLTYHFTCYHTVGKTSGCTICGKWIINPSNMVRHLNMHFSTKPYQCNLCDFSYSRSTSLKRHLLSHSRAGTSSYKCSKCSHVFISKKHLKIHKKTHVSIAWQLAICLFYLKEYQSSRFRLLVQYCPLFSLPFITHIIRTFRSLLGTSGIS